MSLAGADLPADRIPWEERRELGVVRAFMRTLVLSAREPTRFYALAPRDRSPLPAIAYGLVFELVVAIVSFGYDRTLGADELARTLATMRPQLEATLPGLTRALAALGEGSSIVSLVLAPVSYLVELLSTAAVTWIGLRLTRSLRTSFGALVRIFAYASWVSLFGLLGVSDDPILSALSSLMTLGFGAYAWTIAVTRSQGVTTQRAVLAGLAGSAVAVGVGLVFFVLPLVAVAIWIVSTKGLPDMPK